MSRFDFTGKVVLIAGASRGIGEACAHGFAQRMALRNMARRLSALAVSKRIAKKWPRLSALKAARLSPQNYT